MLLMMNLNLFSQFENKQAEVFVLLHDVIHTMEMKLQTMVENEGTNNHEVQLSLHHYTQSTSLLFSMLCCYCYYFCSFLS